MRPMFEALIVPGSSCICDIKSLGWNLSSRSTGKRSRRTSGFLNPIKNSLFSHQRNARLMIPAVSSDVKSCLVLINDSRFSFTSRAKSQAFTTKRVVKMAATAESSRNHSVRARRMSRGMEARRYSVKMADGCGNRTCSVAASQRNARELTIPTADTAVEADVACTDGERAITNAKVRSNATWRAHDA